MCIRDSRVTVLEARDRILSRSLPAEAAQAVAQVHDEEGVDIRTGVGIESFRGNGSVSGVVSADGGVIDADAVVVGSALVRIIADHGRSDRLLGEVGRFVRALKKGVCSAGA